MLNTICPIHLFPGTNHHQDPCLGHGCHNKGHWLQNSGLLEEDWVAPKSQHMEIVDDRLLEYLDLVHSFRFSILVLRVYVHLSTFWQHDHMERVIWISEPMDFWRVEDSFCLNIIFWIKLCNHRSCSNFVSKSWMNCSGILFPISIMSIVF